MSGAWLMPHEPDQFLENSSIFSSWPDIIQKLYWQSVWPEMLKILTSFLMSFLAFANKGWTYSISFWGDLKIQSGKSLRGRCKPWAYLTASQFSKGWSHFLGRSKIAPRCTNQKNHKNPLKGIEWINIDYFNNKPIVNLIEARPGILTLLDEECLRPGVTNDETLLDKFNTYLNKEQFYESREKNKKEK